MQSRLKLSAAPLIHTYSIVARDPTSGEMGVAVQSHYFATGSVVTWAEAGVGAVATQAFADPSYGKLGLDLMRAGRPAPDALAGLLAADAMREIRQVAMIDAHGRVAAHTGRTTIPAAGHIVGAGFSVQANMMLRDTVWPAMAAAFESSRGELADRMIAALDAAEREGGDIRGKQSAAVLVVGGKGSGQPWNDKIHDVRVDDAAQPLAELRRMLGISRASHHIKAAETAAEVGDFETMNREFELAEPMMGDNPEMRFWRAVTTIAAGRHDEGLAMLREVGARDRNWIELALRLPHEIFAIENLKERIRGLLPK
jgi:uncharacterized Ntn-hydrolase superfamily protein